jgi:hypothetical protein
MIYSRNAYPVSAFLVGLIAITEGVSYPLNISIDGMILSNDALNKALAEGRSSAERDTTHVR